MVHVFGTFFSSIPTRPSGTFAQSSASPSFSVPRKPRVPKAFRVLTQALLLCSCLAVAHPLHAQGATLGAGAVTATSEYRATSAHTLPFPLIQWENERFYVKGTGVGAFLWSDGPWRISAGLSWLPKRFDPDDSDSRAMRALDKRHSTMLATAGWEYASEHWGTLSLRLSADVLDTFGGLMAEASYARPVDFGPFTFTPRLGVLWTSAEYNDYYYGISAAEAHRSGFGRFEAGNGFSPFASLRGDLFLTQNWGLYALVSATLLSSEIRDSPMVDEDFTYGLAAGMMYRF